jgi:hypothetical protein
VRWLGVLAAIALLPLLPLVMLRDWTGTLRFERRRRGAWRTVEALDDEAGGVRFGEHVVRRRDVRVARAWTHEHTTMASGPEELLVVELELVDGRTLRVDEPASGAVIAALGLGPLDPVPLGRSGGLSGLMLLLWCAAVGVVAAILSIATC